MQTLKIREEKMKEKAKLLPRRDFIKNIASRRGIVLRKNKSIFSNYPETDRVKITTYKNYIANRDANIDTWREYDFSQDFFTNLSKLLKEVALPNVNNIGENENADFCEWAWNTKNAYLTFDAISDVKNVFYSLHIKEHCSDVYNSVMVWDWSSNVYSCAGVLTSFNVFYSRYIVNSSFIYFSTNLEACQECIFCNGLSNQSYCINNQQLSKEEYFEEKDKILKNKEKFARYYSNLPYEWQNIWSTESQNSSFALYSSNVSNAVKSYQVSHGRNIISIWSKEWWEYIYNCVLWWSPRSTHYYGGLSVWGTTNMFNCYCSYRGSNIYYSMYLEHCSYCLGCIGIKNKSFCILNKQYTKEERFELADKIFAQMEKDWTLGEFFPWRMNPFYFNDTVAYLIDDTFTKEEVEKDWYLWRDEEIKVDIPAWAEVIKTYQLNEYQWFDSEGKRKINPEILKKVIQDEKWNFYRIIPMELEFLQKHGLPLPEIHWLERIKLGFKFV